MGEKATEEEEEIMMRGKKGSAKGDEVAPGGGDPAGIAINDPGMPAEDAKSTKLEGSPGEGGEPESPGSREGNTINVPLEKGGSFDGSGDPLKGLNVSKGGKGGGKSKS